MGKGIKLKTEKKKKIYTIYINCIDNILRQRKGK